MSSPPASDKDHVIGTVEQVFESIVANLLQEQPISISLKYKQKPQHPLNSTKPAFNIQSHSFPGNSPREAWRFSQYISTKIKLPSTEYRQTAVLFRILGLIHEALISGNIVSKR